MAKINVNIKYETGSYFQFNGAFKSAAFANYADISGDIEQENLDKLVKGYENNFFLKVENVKFFSESKSCAPYESHETTDTWYLPVNKIITIDKAER